MAICSDTWLNISGVLHSCQSYSGQSYHGYSAVHFTDQNRTVGPTARIGPMLIFLYGRFLGAVFKQPSLHGVAYNAAKRKDAMHVFSPCR